ncbi:unnamed protein product [Brassica oleracea]
MTAAMKLSTTWRRITRDLEKSGAWRRSNRGGSDDGARRRPRRCEADDELDKDEAGKKSTFKFGPRSRIGPARFEGHGRRKRREELPTHTATRRADQSKE